ncbi:hypothetical protein GCM10009718_29730 [Isoptericola halotolerans]|uniref:ATP synthase protein I n=1 Tax=Isoptericola halotolerans TaxID=300560 RepID=A0ABX2A4U6_9MICO|nr:hypothetical protein [Isoptericola halotolerans]NOV97686.1 hypothetical protein [Isoptericola halotolerans]
MTAQPPAPDSPEETGPDPVATGRSFEEVHAEERLILRRAMRDTFVLVVSLLVLGALVGGLVVGPAGVWGAALGAGVAAFFCGTTIWSMQRTVGAPPARMAAFVMGAWLAKIVVLLVVLVVLRGADFYDPYVFGAVLLVGVIGSALLDYRAVARGRMPYVQP